MLRTIKMANNENKPIKNHGVKYFLGICKFFVSKKKRFDCCKRNRARSNDYNSWASNHGNTKKRAREIRVNERDFNIFGNLSSYSLKTVIINVYYGMLFLPKTQI